MKQLLGYKKYPTNKSNHVGVEIEFVLHESKDETLRNQLVEQNLHYNVHLGHDGSVEDKEFVPKYEMRSRYNIFSGNNSMQNVMVNSHERCEGRELRIIATEEEAPGIIDSVCLILQNLGAKVNTTCGLHVHLDMRNRNKTVAFDRLFNGQSILFKLVDETRRKNKYCKMLRKKTLQPKTKYYGLNKMALKEHGTIEVRMHQGSINPVQIRMWVALLSKIVDTDIGNKKFKLTDLGTDSSIKDYYTRKTNASA